MKVNESDFVKMMTDAGLHNRHFISYSKSMYRKANPNHLVMFNARILSGNKIIWWGDLDLTLDLPVILNLFKDGLPGGKQADFKIYYESSFFARSEHKDNDEYLIHVINDTFTINSKYSKYYKCENGTIYLKNDG